VAGYCEHDNEPSVFYEESRLLFDKLSDYQLFKECIINILVSK
jgi:hypothetical protein